MCGLTGLLIASSRRAEELEGVARRMADTLVHRGPDDSGSWADESAGVALGFRRLSIVDLSIEGHQPMASASGRFRMAFNGEVYNHEALRQELRGAGWSFRGHSDSEVMLACFERWGVAAALPRFVGMFAVAVWDAELRQLTLARDRLGKKPLFFYHEPGVVTFASELKALAVTPWFDRSIDRDAVVAYLRYLYVPGPASIYRRVRKLLPGHLLTLGDPGAPLPEQVPYWRLSDVAAAGEESRFPGDERDAEVELDSLLSEAVQLRMQADVPVGALLSGGVDSSTVVAIMQKCSSRKVRTYTIGFDQRDHNEVEHARAVAAYLGTDHTELILTGDDALALVPRLSTMFDEPLADPSQLPTFLVCQAARRDVTVALTGDGGDEVFAGYNRYVYGARLLPRLARIPRVVGALLGAGLGAVGGGAWDALHRGVRRVIPGADRHRLVGLKVRKLRRLLRQDSEAGMYRSLMSAWDEPANLVVGGIDEPGPFLRGVAADRPRGLVDRMVLADQASYLPDDLLAKLDRASMAVSLEARAPILDHRVVEFAWRLPLSYRLRDSKGKWILRQVLYRHVPAALVDRPKVGFSVPLSTWLRGPLRAWGEDLVASQQPPGEEFLNLEAIRRAWRGFLESGAEDDAAGLWAVLVLIDWRQRWGG